MIFGQAFRESGRFDDHRPVTAALAQALATRRRASSSFTAQGLIHHSDAGSQYTALGFTEELRAAGIAGSIGSVEDALDNALMESTIGLYKTEWIRPGARRRNWSRTNPPINQLSHTNRARMMYATSIAQRGEVA